ncbi:MAG: T9SS type A sorting domain-containing protein [Bacteroidetes bacterium]|nr:T9SS type A sorting domain-containing protein [Bacteroidota bacterium]
MKEIVIVLVSFLGIYTAAAQAPAAPLPDTAMAANKNATPADSIRASVKLFPNPAKNKAELEVKGFEPGLVQLQIADISGKKLRNDQRLLTTGNENMVVMFSLPPGIYFIILKQKNQLVKKKMVVQ